MASPGDRHEGLLRHPSMPLGRLGNPRPEVGHPPPPPPTLTRARASSGRCREGASTPCRTRSAGVGTGWAPGFGREDAARQALPSCARTRT
eukprot:11224737-Lingulodinium_polyedra.AAC.1